MLRSISKYTDTNNYQQLVQGNQILVEESLNRYLVILSTEETHLLPLHRQRAVQSHPRMQNKSRLLYILSALLKRGPENICLLAHNIKVEWSLYLAERLINRQLIVCHH